LLSLGWFSTGRGNGSRGLLQSTLDAIHNGDLDAYIKFVFCNRSPGEHAGSDSFIDLCSRYNLPLVTLSSQEFQQQKGARSMSDVRDEFHHNVMKTLDKFSPETSVLAGYGLITSSEMCKRYTLLNLHPALPGGPTGTWKQVIDKLIQQRSSTHGVMVHLATEHLDQGPVLSYTSFPIAGGSFDPLWSSEADKATSGNGSQRIEESELFKGIRIAGIRRERPLLVETLKALASGRIKIIGHQVQDTQGNQIQGICLNSEVEIALTNNFPTDVSDAEII